MWATLVTEHEKHVLENMAPGQEIAQVEIYSFFISAKYIKTQHFGKLHDFPPFFTLWSTYGLLFTSQSLLEDKGLLEATMQLIQY